MALQLLIGGVDKTANIEAGSLKISNILTKKRDAASFSILNHTGDSYCPSLGRDVTIYDGATKIFGGVITEIESRPNAYAVVRHKITCQDYTRLLDKKLVPDSYENMTVNQIIASMQSLYFPSGFTINNVNAPVLISYIAFKYKPLAKCLEELAEAINYDWYVDYDKDIHFFAKESTLAPFNLADNTGTYRYDSLVIRKDNTQVRNSIVVRGGEYLGSNFTAEIECNGTDFVFPLPYKFTDFNASLTGQRLNVGIDYIDTPETHDALYNFNEKILRFREERKPSIGSVLRAGGKPHLPVIVKYKSPVHIHAMASAEGTLTADSHYEYLIEDKSINSKEGARQRAKAEILAYAQTLSEGEFVTETSGLRAGHKITVNSASRGVNEDFIINKVTIEQFGADSLLYTVSLITTRTFDLIDILQRLLLESTKKIEINENEIIDLVEGFEEEAAIGEDMEAALIHNPMYESSTVEETAVTQPINYPVVFVAGAYTPTGATVLVDSYSETTYDVAFNTSNATDYFAQSFSNTNAVALDSVKLYLKKTDLPVGNMTVSIRAHTGAYGSTGKPTGADLAVAGVINSSTLTGSYQLVTFTFTGTNRILLAPSTYYTVVFNFTLSSGSGTVQLGADVSAPAHAGNFATSTDSGVSWTAGTVLDIIFYVYGDDPKRVFTLDGSRLG